MNYDEMYTDCADNWKLVDTRKVEIKGLSCKAELFKKKSKKSADRLLLK